MGDMLSQAEIDALLGVPSEAAAADAESGGGASTPTGGGNPAKTILTSEQKDILGEIGNISMGTAATTLNALLNQKVWITTPTVKEINWEDLKHMYEKPCVGIRVSYKEGLEGSNILILKQSDVKIITNLMMGGDGTDADVDGELTDIDLSAIGEAMNQMVGSSSTSLSSMTKMKIDIHTPYAFQMDFDDSTFFENIGITEFDEEAVAIQFRMEIGDLIDSQIMQMIPTKFALSMVATLKSELSYQAPEGTIPPPNVAAPSPPPVAQAPPPAAQAQYAPPPQPEYAAPPPMQQYPPQPEMMGMPPQAPPPYGYGPPAYQQPYGYAPPPPQQYYQPPQQNVNVQSAQFQNFDFSDVMQQKENIGIIMDVPLEVNVELGRTTKLIREILEFGPGTIVELDKLAGEPVDIYVNGKHVAKGEVVVIDENFGIRITDIVSMENRI